MSLIPALEEIEKGAGHGWNTSNRFSMDTSTGGKQFDYHHLINQNNTGDVPDALVEEEVDQDNGAQNEGSLEQQQQEHHQQQSTQQLQSSLSQQQQQSQQQTQQQHKSLPLNSNISPGEEEIIQKLLQAQREIDENNKKLMSLGLQPHIRAPVISTQTDFNTQQQILNNCDYMGSVGAQSSANQLDESRIRQMLTQTQGATTQRKVDINFPDSNGGYQGNQNQKAAQGVQGHQKTQVITVTGRGQSQVSHPQQRTPVKPSVVQMHVQGNQTTSVSYQSPVQVQTVSTNQAHNQSVVKQTTQMQKINKNNVVLEGGGQFEEGQAYVIRDRHGNARTMLWKNGEFHPFDKEKGVVIQHSAIDSSQRGRGARDGRGRGRGRGQGQLYGNATGVHMTQNVRGVNSVSKCQRSVEQVKKKWIDLKSQTKKKTITHIAETKKTGGGPAPVLELESWESKVLQTIPACSVEGIKDGADTFLECVNDYPQLPVGSITDETVLNSSGIERSCDKISESSTSTRKRQSCNDPSPSKNVAKRSRIENNHIEDLVVGQTTVMKELVTALTTLNKSVNNLNENLEKFNDRYLF